MNEKNQKSKNSAIAELLDLRCFCKRCEERTKETYQLEVLCSNCGWKGIALLRKDDEASRMKECPNCGCSWVLCFGEDPKYQ